MKELHSQMNLLLSRLNEQQRRWYVALEAKKIGHRGVKQMSIVTRMNSDTIKQGRLELEDSLSTRPVERERVFGGGRPKVEKKPRNSTDTVKARARRNRRRPDERKEMG